MKIERIIPEANTLYKQNSADKILRNEKEILSDDAVVFDSEKNKKDNLGDQTSEKKEDEHKADKHLENEHPALVSKKEIKPLSIIA